MRKKKAEKTQGQTLKNDLGNTCYEGQLYCMDYDWHYNAFIKAL